MGKVFSHWRTQVRKAAADQMCTVLLTYDEVLPEDVLDRVVTILADTTWYNHVIV